MGIVWCPSISLNKGMDMKNMFIMAAIILLVACSGGKKQVAARASYDGTFTVQNGLLTIELRPDSTTHLLFDDGTNYDGNWTIRQKEGVEYAAIEFGGNSEHYMLRDGQLYRNIVMMLTRKPGMKITYKE